MASQNGVITFAIDIGGTGIKGMLLDTRGKPLTDRLRKDTPHPATPMAMLRVIESIAKRMPNFHRVSVGFPGVVKHGAIVTAPNLDPKWIGLDLETALASRWNRPVRVANDAAVQGFGAVRGRGVELVITLGTGFGSSLFTDGRLVPGLELAHHPWQKSKTYEDFLGLRGFKAFGRARWNQYLEAAIAQLHLLFNYDHLYIGGGNAHKIDFALPAHVTRVPNEDGLLGGAALWRKNALPPAYQRAR
ncbi:MAG TPA: ROK family protein [Bryobacteraceae bacterium]